MQKINCKIKEEAKNENGITLIMLILVIIILIIIAGVSINYMYDGIKYSSEKKILTEVQEVEQAVMQRYTELCELNLQDIDDSYTDFATKLEIDTISDYSDYLAHTYESEEDVTASKYYYGLTESDLSDLGISLKTTVDPVRNLKSSSGDTILYIVNFYYGEVLNIYYSENFKSGYSDTLLYEIGRTIEE